MTTSSTQVGSGIVYFGDSLTDNGNLFSAAEGVITEDLRLDLAGPTGAASDGPTYASYAAEDLGVTTELNYAVAGAEAVGSQPIGDFITEGGYADQVIVPPDDPALDWDMNLGAQVARFAADTSGQDLSDMTAVILVGANDYANLDLSNPLRAPHDIQVAIGQVVAATLAAAVTLCEDGLGAVVICGLPDASFFPAVQAGSPAEIALTESLFAQHDAALQSGVADLQSQGYDVRYLDMTPVTAAIAEDPAGFGLVAPLDVTLTSGDPALAGYDADQVAFWDDEHPSTATHDMLGAYQAYALENTVSTATDSAELGNLDARDNLGFFVGGDDRLHSGAGDDSLFGGTGGDSLSGGRGADQVDGGSDADLLNGGFGTDVLGGSPGNDTLHGGRGADVLLDGLGSDGQHGGAGDDAFVFTQAELIGGTTGADLDSIRGGDGQDTLYIVLDHDSYLALAGDLQGSAPRDALDQLGLSVRGVESIVVLDGREALAGAFAATTWYADANTWGLI